MSKVLSLSLIKIVCNMNCVSTLYRVQQAAVGISPVRSNNGALMYWFQSDCNTMCYTIKEKLGLMLEVVCAPFRNKGPQRGKKTPNIYRFLAEHLSKEEVGGNEIILRFHTKKEILIDLKGYCPNLFQGGVPIRNNHFLYFNKRFLLLLSNFKVLFILVRCLQYTVSKHFIYLWVCTLYFLVDINLSSHLIDF